MARRSLDADESTIVVEVDGVPLAASTTDGWSYDAGTRTVRFNGTGIPAPGSHVSIDYETQTPCP